MIVVAHFVAISFYIAAAALAALPFARRVSAPVNGVIGSLALGLSPTPSHFLRSLAKAALDP